LRGLLPPNKVKHLTEEKQDKFLTVDAHHRKLCNKGIVIFNKKIL